MPSCEALTRSTKPQVVAALLMRASTRNPIPAWSDATGAARAAAEHGPRHTPTGTEERRGTSQLIIRQGAGLYLMKAMPVAT